MPGDEDLLLSAFAFEPVEFIDAERLSRELELGQYRLAWTWLHADDSGLKARALWWGSAGSTHPVALDCLWVHPSVEAPAELATQLLEAAHARFRTSGLTHAPDLNMTFAPRWQDDPGAVAALSWRKAAAAAAGLTEKTERLSFAWTRGAALPRRSTRLRFAAGEDDAFLAVFAQAAAGSLDLLTQRQVANAGAAEQAAADLSFYRSLPGERQLWRLAYSEGGVCIGFIVPSRSAYDASVSYLGVLPQHRGQAYVDDLLAEITHMHAERGEPRITGTTDTVNAPMAAAFLRCGYAITKARIVLSAPGA
jgi:ribosomal protein S18 acetylase RimI-like enzyme